MFMKKKLLFLMSFSFLIFSACSRNNVEELASLLADNGSKGATHGSVDAELIFIPDFPEGEKEILYEINGPSIEAITGTAVVTSNPMAVTIPGVPGGPDITLKVHAADGSCSGKATFDVITGETTRVQVPVQNMSISALDQTADDAAGAPASLSDYVDDGRYDYGLSQPNPGYSVKVDKGVAITMRDGIKLKGDVYRPDAPGRFPVIMAQAPYPRWLAGTGMGGGVGIDDNGGAGTKYQSFEEANPEYWIPRGYVYIRVSTRGYGGSGGQTAALDAQEYYDYYDMIEWAAQQPWSNGNIGLFGISYFAFSQYYVAGLKPPHLKAIVPWEGLADPYRDIGYRGGIPCLFSYGFAAGMQILANNPFTAVNYIGLFPKHCLLDEAWEYGIGVITRPDEPQTIRILDILSDIDVPMLSVGNLNDPDLHLRGNVFAFTAARSPKKKLMLFTGTHWGSSYQPWANRTVLRFMDHWLKGVDTGIYGEPAVDVQLRTASDTFTHVFGDTWPLPQTQWTQYYLDAGTRTMSTTAPQSMASAETEHVHEPGVGSSDRLTFRTAPLGQDVAIAGPVTAHLWVSSSTKDVDLTVELRDFDADGKETRFAYYIAGNPDEPVSRGWLRASMRELDPVRSKPHQPFFLYSHNDWLTPGVPVPVDVEIWPTSMLFKAGHSIVLTIHCGPYTRAGEAGFLAMGAAAPAFLAKMKVPVYQTFSSSSGTTRIYTGGEHSSWLELPVIPSDTAPVHRITVSDGNFSPATSNGQMGDRFDWSNAGVDYHTATESGGLGLWDSQLINGSRSHNPETWGIKIMWAGTFSYRDMVSGFSGSIAIPARAPQTVAAGSSAAIELGTAAPPAGKGFDVQIQKDGGEWTTIAAGVSAAQVNTPPLAAGTYAVRTRLVSLNPDKPGASGWSPLVYVIVR
jgi:predicted acyl esterase